MHALLRELFIKRRQRRARYLIAAFDRVRAIHNDFRLNNRHNFGFLTQRRIARQRMRIGGEAAGTWQAVGDIDNRAPFGEFCAKRMIFVQAVAQAVQPFRHHFAVMSGHRLGTSIDLDAGQGTCICDNLNQRGAVGSLLAQGFVE